MRIWLERHVLKQRRDGAVPLGAEEAAYGGGVGLLRGHDLLQGGEVHGLAEAATAEAAAGDSDELRGHLAYRAVGCVG